MSVIDEPLRLNADGSLIDSGAPRRWYVGFVPPIDKQFWHRFFDAKHKHCFALRYERDNVWTLFEPWWTRLMVQTIDDKQAGKFLRWAKRGDLVCATEHVPGTSSQLRGWMTCAVLCAHVLGRSYWVWTPHQLYKRLVAEPTTARLDPCEIDGLMAMCDC